MCSEVAFGKAKSIPFPYESSNINIYIRRNNLWILIYNIDVDGGGNDYENLCSKNSFEIYLKIKIPKAGLRDGICIQILLSFNGCYHQYFTLCVNDEREDWRPQKRAAK